jgi:hypothetical protein
VIKPPQDREVRRALEEFSAPNPLTVESLFDVIARNYHRPLDLLRGECPLPGLHANALWLTRPHLPSDAIWLDSALTGSAEVHSLAHEYGHILLGHQPVILPTDPEPEPEYELLSADFLGGCLLGRARSQDGPSDPLYQRYETQAEDFAHLLRRKAADQARDTRYQADPLLDRLHRSL